MDQPDCANRYRIGIRIATKALRKLGRERVDGREANDFAIDALYHPMWSARVIQCDVIDAYRRERGRNTRKKVLKKRSFVRFVDVHVAEDPEPDWDWMKAWVMSPNDRRIALLISQGLTKTETAKRLGITQTAVYQALKRLGRQWTLDNGGTLET
jgi:DNA-directed RNA polymerase specialized sigma24 family protein